MIRFIMLSLCLCFCVGCASTTAPISATEDRKDVESALETIVEAISGSDISEEEMKELKNQIRHDPEAQSAIEVITNSVSGQQRWKYSPATGKRYAPHLEIDPETGVPLKWVE